MRMAVMRKTVNIGTQWPVTEIIVKFEKAEFTVLGYAKVVIDGMGNSEDPDQTALKQSDQGLHCLPVHVSPSIEGHHGIAFLK